MTATIAADYLPRPRVQLDGTRHAGGNCGCVACANGLAWSTGGRVRPTPAACRDALGGSWVGLASKPPSDATSLLDQARAWASFRDDAKAKGLRLGTFTRRLMDPWSEVLDAIDAGDAVLLQYNYGVINERMPALSGSPTFMGDHIALIPRVRRRAGGVELLVFDGLYDGRRKGIPKGPQWVPAWVLKQAAEEKVRLALIAGGMPPSKARDKAAGTAVFAIISRSAVIAKPIPDPVPDPTPDPTPEPTCDERVAAAVAETVLRYDARINALELALGTARTALENAGDSIGAAIADIDELIGAPGVDQADPAEGVGVES